MTKNQTSLSDQGKKCRICTGCGRCAGAIPDIRIVTGAPRPVAVSGDSMDNSMDNSMDSSMDGSMDSSFGKAEGLMVAADIGTTTIAMQLRDMADGRVLDTFRAVNPQRKYGADVLSRIQEAEDPQGEAAGEMRRMVREILEEGVLSFRTSEESRGAAGREIRGMVIAANTTMIYLLMGYPAAPLGRVPFTAEHLGEINTQIGGLPTIIMPGISAFVGADVLAGMYAERVGLPETSQAVDLLIDLGTNGEIALGNGERILATATAAGPAFEGRMGVGVWGADTVKFLEALLEQGLMDETGLLADAYFDEGVPIGGIIMTQEDIRSLQLAKAAICAGVRILCRQYGLRDMAQIRNVYLAGGFGYYLDPAAAAAIGLIPSELAGKCLPVGNSALEGAFCYGRGRLGGDAKTAEAAGRKLQALKDRTEPVNLAESEGFFDQYVEAMNF